MKNSEAGAAGAGADMTGTAALLYVFGDFRLNAALVPLLCAKEATIPFNLACYAAELGELKAAKE
ncbi:MAG: hypothetical protein JO295_04495 [Verrucomicrobia bacterium]|nr:hypothetical protein [Verrucomicrobiota bacterium]